MTLLDDWLTRIAIPFSLDDARSLNGAIDRLIEALGDQVEMLGFGEPMHGGDEALTLRNRLFERLVARHGYSVIAIESSFPKGRQANEFVAGHGTASIEEVRETGFGHGFGKLEANRELLEWMRAYNADAAHETKLRFYGFDIPTGPTGNVAPRGTLQFAVDYLASVDAAAGAKFRERIDPLVGPDFDWENPAYYADPSPAPGLSPRAATLRVETEELISELRVRGPELIAASDDDRYAEALQIAVVARQMFNYHAAFARNAGHAVLLGIRDAMMADNLRYIADRERGRGKVFVFAHNAHLKRGWMAASESWYRALGAGAFGWWPAGAHLDRALGSRYAVIGTAVGVSEANGISTPAAGTLEAKLTTLPGPGRFVPTHEVRRLHGDALAAIPKRSESAQNLSYIPFDSSSAADFDAWAAFDAMTYTRGAPPLPS